MMQQAPSRGRDRVRLFGFKFHGITLDAAADEVLKLAQRQDTKGAYVVTPNLDHCVLLREDPSLEEVYEGAALVLADGQPLVWMARVLGLGLPQRVAGSDLLPKVCERAQETITVFLLGAAAGVAQEAGRILEARYPKVKVVGSYSPPLGFETDAAEVQSVLERVSDARPQLLIIGLGAPRQERWAHRYGAISGARVCLCLGGTIDFVAGRQRRAPRWMRRSGLEWLYRAASQPRRLALRYAKDALAIPALIAQELRSRRGSPP